MAKRPPKTFRKLEKADDMPIVMEGMFERRITFTDKELPQIKDWEVGKDYEIVLKVRQHSVREHDKGTKADFIVNSVKAG